MTVQTIDSLVQKAMNLQKPTESPITLSFFHNKKKDWVNLAEKDGAEIKIGEFDAEYSLRRPYLAHRISISGAEELKPTHLKIEVQNLDGSWTEIQGESDSSDKNIIHFDLSQFIKKIKLSYKHKGFGLFSKVRLKSVNIRGWDKEGFDALESATDSYFSIENSIKELAKNEKTKIDNANAALVNRESAIKTREDAITQKEQASQQKLTELNAQIKESEATLKEKETDIKKKSTEVEKLTQSITNLTTKKDQVSKDFLDLETKASEKKQELQVTIESISTQKIKLQELNKDVSLFADDIKGFAHQGTSQIKRNMWAFLIPAIVVAAVVGAWSIWFSERVYADFIAAHGTLQFWEMLGFRLFSLLCVAAVLGFIYKFCRPFILQIIAIDKKRLSLSEISILTQDTTDSATFGLDVDDDEKLQIRITSRMAIIREYLSGKFDTSSIADLPKKNETEALFKSLLAVAASSATGGGLPIPPKSSKEEKQKQLQ